jgi:hypothetical protein
MKNYFSSFFVFCIFLILDMKCYEILSDKIIVENDENYISIINKNNLQIYELKASKLRNLQSAFFTLQNACSQKAGYSFNGKRIKRVSHPTPDDTYIMIQSEGFYSFAGQIQNVPPKINWQVKPLNIIDGGIFFGVCGFDNSNPPSSCYTNVDISTMIYYSGISIIYFAPNCYHIDHYLNNQYWTTPRHCLSEFELLQLVFSFSLQYDGKMGSGLAYLYITYDGFEYYSRSNLYVVVDTNIIPNVSLTQVYPCVALYVPNTEIEIISASTYP